MISTSQQHPIERSMSTSNFYIEAAEYFSLSLEETQGIIALCEEQIALLPQDQQHTRQEINAFISNLQEQERMTNKTPYSESKKVKAGKRRVVKKLGFHVFHSYVIQWSKHKNDDLVKSLHRLGFSQVEIRGTLPNLGGSRYDRIMRDMRSQNPMDTTMEATTTDPTITALPRPNILHREISEPTITVSATSPKNIDDPAITEDSLARSSVISTHPLATTAITPESTKALEAVSRLVISANDGSLSSLASTHNRTTTATTSDSTCTLDLNKIITTEQESHLSILQTTIATIPELSSTSDNSNSSDETLAHPRTSQDTTIETVTSIVTTMLPIQVEKETKKNKETTTITRTTATSCFRKVPFERHLMKLKNNKRKVPVEDNFSPFPSEEIVKLKEEANKAEIIGLKKNEVDLRAEIQILKTAAIQQEQRKQHDLKEIARLQDEAEKYKEENISLRTEMYTLLRELPLQDSKRHQLELKKTVKVEDTDR